MRWLICTILSSLSLMTQAARPWPFRKQKKYTPLLFFTGPPGLSPQIDAVEKVVKQVEKDLNVHVERMDLWRQPEAEAVMRSLSNQVSAPFLYNRESLQVYYLPPSAGKTPSSSVDEDGEPTTTTSSRNNPLTHVDYEQIRSWAKGRYLGAKVDLSGSAAAQKGTKVRAPHMDSNEDGGMEQEELLEDMTLTPLQRKGKEAMKERTEKLAKQ